MKKFLIEFVRLHLLLGIAFLLGYFLSEISLVDTYQEKLDTMLKAILTELDCYDKEIEQPSKYKLEV